MPADLSRYNQNKIYGNRTRPVDDCMLVAHIPLNGDFFDIKGCNCGTLTGCATFITAPLLNGMTFDGTCDRVNLSNECNFDFNICCAFSVSAWINPCTVAIRELTIAKRLNSMCACTGWSVEFCGTCNLATFAVSNGTTEFSVSSASCSVPDNTWTYVAATKSTASNTSGMKITTDITTATGACLAITGSLLNNCTVAIGGGSCGGAQFNGCIADVRIFDDELTSSEVTRIYSQGRPVANRLNHQADCSILLWTEFNMCVVCQAGNCNNGTWFLGLSACTVAECYVKGMVNKSGNFGGNMCCARTVQISNECVFDFNGNTEFSVSLWARPRVGSSQGDGLVGKSTNLSPGPSAGWVLFNSFSGTERISFGMFTSTFAGTTFNVCCTGFGTEHYTHIVFTKAANRSVSCSHIYINNCKTTGGAGCYPLGALNNCNVGIGGAKSPDTKTGFDGRITCVFIWNRQITDAEVTRLFNER